MSSMPVEAIDKASLFISQFSKEKSVNTSQADDSTSMGKIYEVGRQLVQVARNSLLDADTLRQVLSCCRNCS